MKCSRFQAHKLAALGLAALSIALLGARQTAPPTPAPAFTSTPPPTKVMAAPSVMVYPFEASGEMPKNAGSAVAKLLDQQLTLGGLRVVTPPNGVTRRDYLTTAHANKTDYYISGYLTPLGDGAAMVVQVVTADTGIMIFSKTAQIFTTNDAAAQADAVREVMLAHSGQLPEYGETQPSATPQPESSEGSSLPIGGILGIFKHGAKTDSSGLAPAVASQDKPDRVAIIARVGGNGIDSATLTNATQSLWTVMNRYFRTQPDRSNNSDVAANADAICGSNRNATIAGGTLAELRAHGRERDTFTLRIYTCFGAVIYEGNPVTADSAQGAIYSAASTYATENPTNS